MAIRYLDTGFYKSPFVRSLKGELKSFYIYIILDCSGAGIWTKDIDIASLYLGFNVTEKDFAFFIEKGKAIDLNNGKYFFPDFIDHQYPSGLSEKNPATKNFISELKKYNLVDDSLNVVKSTIGKTLKRPLKDPSKPLNEVPKGTLVTVTVTEEETVTEEVGEISLFEKTFDEFLKMRIRIKKPATDYAQELVRKSLDKLSNGNEEVKIEILNQSIKNSWQDVYQLKTASNLKPSTNGRSITDAMETYNLLKR